MTAGDGDGDQNAATGAWREAFALFERWLALPTAARDAELARVEAERPDLHARLSTLIRADAEAERGAFLGAGAFAALRHDAAPPAADAALAGRRLGAWVLERPLGAGGMGQVWLARRSDGLYEGAVAIKMLRVAFADANANARFAREGQLLARLTHPNIARLLDAGVAADDQRYLVLEYVDGERIDRYCDERRLALDARLALFRQVCAAVAHAHANLVVHRDLKPSNILVQADGAVKLLDFGVAKLLADDGSGDATELTRLAGAGLTPEYAAPEQVAGGAITTATDVYALGVVLYGLVVGRRPYGDARSTPAQLARAIAETDPPRLTAQLAADPAAAAAAATARSTSPERLARELSGDLETIVAKTLKKDPAERYPSVQALADDLDRWRRHEPIAARPDTLAYRSGRFLRRHRLPAALAALALVAVLAGLVAALWQAHEATLQANAARREAAKADAVKRFLLGLFEANSTEKHDSADAQNRTARELLDLGAKEIDGALADQPEVKSEVLAMLSEMYWQIGRFEQAEAMDRARVDHLRGAGRGRTDEMIEALYNHSQTLDNIGRHDEALARGEEALALLDALGAGETELRGRVLLNLGDLQRNANPAQSLAAQERGVDILLRRFPASGALGGAVGNLASSYLVLGRIDDARRTLAQGLALLQQHQPANLVQIGAARGRIAEALQAANRFTAARTEFEEVYRLRLRVSGAAHEDTLTARVYWAALLARGGERARAENELDAAIAAVGPDPANLLPQYWGRGLAFKAALLADAGDAAGAGALLDRIEPSWRAKLASTPLYARLLLLRARQRTLEGRYDDAVALARESAAILAARHVPCHVAGWLATQTEVVALQRAGRADATAPLIAALAACTSAQIDDTPIRVAAALARARDALARGRAGDALAGADAALALVVASPERAFAALDEAEAQRIAGAALAANGRAADARLRWQEAATLLAARQVPGSPELAAVRVALAAAH